MNHATHPTRAHRLRPLAVALTVLLGLAAATSAAAADRVPKAAEVDVLAMDRNGNGTLTATEHAAGTHQRFAQLDANRNGRLTPDELAAAPPQPGRRSVRATVKAIDTDGSGDISEAEHAQASEAAFSRLDTDRDGRLSPVELAPAHAKGLLRRPR